MVADGRGLRLAALCDACERFVLGDLPGDPPVAANEARPENDAIRERISRGDTVCEGACREVLRPCGARRRRE
jgi:hypothetical protein